MNSLRNAAQAALEAMEYNRLDVGKFNRINAACQALRAALAQQAEPHRDLRAALQAPGCERLREWVEIGPVQRAALETFAAALAQQAEPVQEPYTDDVTRIMREAGMTFHLGLPHKAVVEQMTRVVDLVYAEASIKAAQQFAAALAQHPDTDCHTQGICQRSGYGIGKQAEPVEPVAWLYTGIKQDGTEHGPHLVWKPEYMDAMSASKGAKATPLYTSPPQRKPLTKEEIRLLARDTFLEAENIWNEDTREDLTEFTRAVERAHGIGRQSDHQIEDRLARHGIPKP